MLRIKKNKLLNDATDISAIKSKQMTRTRFTMILLGGTSAVLALTLMLTVYAAIVFFANVNKIGATGPFYQNNSLAGKVIYENNKIFYRPEELIKLNIINNTDESIYLAPCQYFNKFEKRVLNEWQAVSLAVCDELDNPADSGSIEKISKKAEESLEAKKLGEGIWRGVAVVYFGCQKAQTSSCTNNRIIYTDEFAIGGLDRAISSNPQL